MSYNADELHNRIMGALQKRYPNFKTMRFIISGPSGSGKSTVLASFPVPKGKIRLAIDMEDSMAYLDAGENGKDTYTPRAQSFAMRRIVMPKISEFIAAFDNLDGIGVVAIDNVAILQDTLVNSLLAASRNQQGISKLREIYTKLGIANALPMDKKIMRWAEGPSVSPEFWSAVKAIPRAIILNLIKNGIHLIISTEEANVWKDYGTSDAKVIGKKAKIWDVWLQYMDAVIMLKRDPNNPVPIGQMNMLQPKMRLQGLNPSWKMDWINFAKEIEDAVKRTNEAIPEEAKIREEVLVEEGV